MQRTSTVRSSTFRAAHSVMILERQREGMLSPRPTAATKDKPIAGPSSDMIGAHLLCRKVSLGVRCGAAGTRGPRLGSGSLARLLKFPLYAPLYTGYPDSSQGRGAYMTSRDDFDPLFGVEKTEIPLPNAPLVRVLAQVRFTEILSIGKKEFIAEFQETIRKVYPRLQAEEQVVIISGGSEPDVRREKIWRLYDADNVWRTSLATNFLVLETTSYISRIDFMTRFRTLLEALGQTIGPTHVSRVGVRYVDHVREPELQHIDEMLRSQMLGVTTSDVRPRILHSFSEALCQVAEGSLLTRWGFLPPRGTHDPSVMSAVEQASWFLDLDVFQEHTEHPLPYDPDRLHDVALTLATRAYSFFRWATTPRFLSIYGGKA